MKTPQTQTGQDLQLTEAAWGRDRAEVLAKHQSQLLTSKHHPQNAIESVEHL